MGLLESGERFAATGDQTENRAAPRVFGGERETDTTRRAGDEDLQTRVHTGADGNYSFFARICATRKSSTWIVPGRLSVAAGPVSYLPCTASVGTPSIL